MSRRRISAGLILRMLSSGGSVNSSVVSNPTISPWTADDGVNHVSGRIWKYRSINSGKTRCTTTPTSNACESAANP